LAVRSNRSLAAMVFLPISAEGGTEAASAKTMAATLM
jgi:hypothetical protein